MSITDELREWKGHIQTRLAPEAVLALRGELNAIADRIDAEHESVRAESIIDMTDESMAEHGWVRLPKDADGVTIRIGDELDSLEALHPDVPARFKVQDMFYYGNGKWHLRAYPATYKPEKCRHHHAPTVEDVLREFALKAAGRECMTMRNDLVDEYAAKLQLREDA